MVRHYGTKITELLGEEFIKQKKRCLKCETVHKNLSDYKWHMTFRHNALHPLIRQEFLPQYNAIWDEMNENRKRKQKISQEKGETSSCKISPEIIKSECSQSQPKKKAESFDQISKDVIDAKEELLNSFEDLITVKEEFETKTEYD